MKTCVKCGSEKHIDQFHKHKTSKDGTHAVCKSCRNENKKLYYQLNRHISIEKANIYAQTNKVARVVYNKTYRQANLDKKRALNANYRARKRESIGKHTAADVRALFILQKGVCICCHANLNKGYHVDHIYPISKGGSNDKHNLQLLCQPCNNQKRAEHPIDFMQSRGFLL